jgi:hypothetical protein
MRKLILLFLLSLSAGLLLAACNSRQPSIVLETTKLDLGHVINGEIIVGHKINVRNEGKADLVIDSVTTSCSCTQATLSPMVITPGETGILTIEFDSGAHGPELTGELIRQVFVTSNDPIQPEATVEMSVFVDPKPS